MPRLSIVVPVYDVEDYLDECLTSLADQTMRDLEVVMVDDGSTDRSADIAREWVARDPRFRLVQQTNHGLGHARNTGVAAATGELLTFVDSDDVIPRSAYALMCSTLERSGSDFATGNVARFDSRGRRPSGLHREAFARTVTGTHITRMPALLSDRLAPNKVFVRSFWDRHELRFPEGVLYEDIPVTIPAHYLARSVDVIKQTVYLWREREGDSLSITQDRTHLRGLEDRFAAIGSVRRFLCDHADRAAVDAFDDVALRSDIRIFMDALGDAGEPFRARWLELADGYLADVSPHVLELVPAHLRLQYALAARGLMPELVEANRFARLEREDAGVIRVGPRYLGDYPFRGEPALALPDSVFDVTDELALVTNVSDVEWVGARLRVRGWAFVRRIDAPTVADVHLAAWVVAGGERRPVPLRQQERPEANHRAKSAVHDYTGSGFVLDIPLRWAILRRARRSVTWHVEIEVTAGGVTRHGRLAQPLPGRPQRPPSRTIQGMRVQPRYDEVRALLVDASRPPAIADGLRVEGTDLVLSGRRQGPARGSAEVVVRRRSGPEVLRFDVTPSAGDRFTARLALADVAEAVPPVHRTAHLETIGLDDGIDWDVSVVVPGRPPRKVVLDDGAAEVTARVGPDEVAVNRTRTGNLTVQVRPPRPVIDAAAWVDGGLVLSGRFAAPEGARLEVVLDRQGDGVESFFAAEQVEGRFTATVTPDTALGGGRYDVEVVARTPDGSVRRYDARLDHALLDGLPVALESDGRPVTFGDMHFDHPVLQAGELPD